MAQLQPASHHRHVVNSFDADMTVFVSSLPFCADSSMLRNLFERVLGISVSRVYVIEENKPKKAFHCGYVMLQHREQVEEAIRKGNGYRLFGRDISVIRFDPTSTLEATPPGPVHFSFKSANPGIPAITEQSVRDALQRICGHLIDVVIRQQTNAQDNGCICGYGFLTCMTLFDTINAVKYTYQRLIDDVVFDCQFSDVFQKGPHFTPELKRLKHERKNFHAALPYAVVDSNGLVDGAPLRSRALEPSQYGREYHPAVPTDLELHQQFTARPGLPQTSFGQSPPFPPTLRTPRDYPLPEHFPSSDRYYGQPSHAQYYPQRSAAHLPQDAHMRERERRQIELQEYYRSPYYHHPLGDSSSDHFFDASMYGRRDVPRISDHTGQMFDDRSLYQQRVQVGLDWPTESATKEDWSDVGGRLAPNRGFSQGDLSLFHRSDSTNRMEGDDFHVAPSVRGLPSRSSSSLFSSTQPFAYP